jgi:predicted adenine nucleotide alpha hydrolase (AANH) superfamily ATPase
MNKYSLANYQREKISTPNGEKKLLLHSCCAPCAGEIMLALKHSKIDTTIYFYNPNIHPIEEYELRKLENIKFAKKLGMPFIDADYDVDNWFELTKGQENEPERGERCTTCFDMRFLKTAKYAKENGFDLISSTLGISRWKDMQQINDCGHRSGADYDVPYWDVNWRKKGGSSRMLEVSKQEGFYQQEYCGCVYSLRDTNKWRMSKGREKVNRGTKFYTQAIESLNT